MSARVTMRCLGRYGQWGNQVIEYSWIRSYARRHGAEYGVPEWGGQYLYGFEDPAITENLPEMVEPVYPDYRHEQCCAIPMQPAGSEILGHNYRGYCQYHTSYYRRDKDFLQGLFAQPAEPQAGRMAAPLARLRSMGDTIIALHLRRGDCGRMIFWFTPVLWCLKWLKQNWERFEQPVLLLVVEDQSLVEPFLAYHPVTAETLGIEFTAQPYPKYTYPMQLRKERARQIDFFPEWYLMQHADVILGSDSTYNFTAAWTSTVNRELWRARLSTQRFERIDPWNADFSWREHLDDFPGVPGTQIDQNTQFPEAWGNWKPTHPSVPEDPKEWELWLKL